MAASLDEGSYVFGDEFNVILNLLEDSEELEAQFTATAHDVSKKSKNISHLCSFSVCLTLKVVQKCGTDTSLKRPLQKKTTFKSMKKMDQVPTVIRRNFVEVL